MKHVFSRFSVLLMMLISHVALGQAQDFVAKVDSLLKMNSPRTFNGVVVVAQEGKGQYAACEGKPVAAQKYP